MGEPRRLWRYPPADLTRPWALQLLRGSDEYCNPTLCVGLPGLGMWVLAYRPGRLRDRECYDPDTCGH